MLQPQKLQLAQIGVETSLGSGGTANRRLKSLMFGGPNYETFEDDEESMAFKTMTGTIIGKEMSSYDVSGRLTYNESNYIWSTILCEAAITTPADALLTRRWTYLPSAASSDTLKSLMIQLGYQADAAQARACRMATLGITFDPGKAEIALTGRMLGKNVSDGQAFTSTPTLINAQNVSGNQFGVFVSDDNTEWTRVKVLQLPFEISDRQHGVYTADETEPSFDDYVEVGLNATAKLIVGKSSTSNSYLDSFRAAETKYLKIECVGPQIELIEGDPDDIIFRRKLTISMPFNFRQPGRQAEQDVHCAVFTCKNVYDAAFGGSLKVVVDTEMTTL